jgi:hypothetical protein
MKLRKGDYIFVIVYLIILFFLLFITPVTVGGGSDSGVDESLPLWDGISRLLLYVIAVPIVYLLLRRYLYPKKKTD